MTIKRISEIAGVSPATVSFVLNNRKGVSEETRQKVLKIIEQENYTPNINSRRLILKRSFNITFVSNERFSLFSDFFIDEIMKSIAERSLELGYNIILLPKIKNNNDSKLDMSIKQGNVDGVIFFQDIPVDLYQSITKAGIPVVVIDAHAPNPIYPCIRIDYEQAAYTAVKHLIEQGHRDIAYIGIEKLPDFYIACFNGYKKALCEHSLTLHPQWINGQAYDGDGAFNAMESILQTPKLPTAVFCGNDLLAIGAMRCAYCRGHKVPQDISFVAIDDILISRYYYPALTTIHLDAVDLGVSAMEMLHTQITGALEQQVYTSRSDSLVIRESVANIAAS